MAEEEISPVRGVSADTSIHQAQKAHAKQQMNNMVARQVESQEDFQSLADQALFNPITMRKKFEKLDDRIKRPVKEEQAQKSEDSKENLIIFHAVLFYFPRGLFEKTSVNRVENK